MIVACPSCGTRFELDENRLTRDVARVRCSRCQQVFEVARPAAASPGLPAAPPPTPTGEPAAPREILESLTPLSPPSQARPASSPAAADTPVRPSRLPLALAIAGGVLLGLVLGIFSLWFTGTLKFASWNSPLSISERVIVVPPPLPSTGPENLTGLVLETKEARFRGLVNKKGGQILVIQGEAENHTPEPRGPIRLKATLTDDRDRVVGERLFYSGTTFSDQELQDLDPDEINRWLDVPGGRDAAPQVLPGGKQAFTMVFFGVPADLAEARYGFTMTVVQGPRAAGQ